MGSRIRLALPLRVNGRERGVALIFDSLIAIIIIMVGLAAYSLLAIDVQPEPDQGFGKYAMHVLSFLDSEGYLAQLIERHDSQAMRKIIGELLPEGTNYCVCVYSPNWELIWYFFSQGFDWRNAAASSPYLVSSESNPEPYLVTLTISK